MRSSTFVRALFVLAAASCAAPLGGCASNGEIKVIHDPFNGDTRAFALYLDMGGYSALGVSEAKGDWALDVMVVQPGVVNIVGQAGDKGQFMIGGEVLELPAAGETRPVSSANRYAVFTQWRIRYKFTREVAERFAAAPITAFKVAVGEQTFQTNVEPKLGKKFQDNLITMTQAQGAPAK